MLFTYVLHNEYKYVQSVFGGLDWTGLASDPLSRTGLDQDHRLTDLDWTGFSQMDPFHTLLFFSQHVGIVGWFEKRLFWKIQPVPPEKWPYTF